MTSSNNGQRAGIDNGYCRLIVHRTVTFIVSFQPCYAPDVRVVAMGLRNICVAQDAPAQVFTMPLQVFFIPLAPGSLYLLLKQDSFVLLFIPSLHSDATSLFRY
jgi:hypothetical protein